MKKIKDNVFGLTGSTEHGDSRHAAGQQDPGCTRAALGIRTPQR